MKSPVRAFATGISLLATLGLGVLNIPYPIGGDQAFSLVGGEALARGATLYTDFWDIRQPGVYWFYGIADRFFAPLFSHRGIGVHLLELLWMAITAWVAISLGRELTPRRRLAALAPLLTVGMYYAHTIWFFAEPEALMSLPLAVCLLVALKDRRASSSPSVAASWLAFGVATGVTAVFKAGIVLIPTALACVALRQGLITDPARRVLLLRILPALGGFAAVVLLVIVHFWTRGALEALYWATFVAPSLALAELPAAPLHRLVSSAMWFATMWFPAAPLIWIGFRTRRDRTAAHLLTAWIAAALVAILLQRFCYWRFHFFLLLMPVGLLVLLGVDEVLARLRTSGRESVRIATLVLTPLLLVACLPVLTKVLPMYGAATRDGRFLDNYYSLLSPEYQALREAAAAIGGPAARTGRIFVFGRPDILLYSGREQAIPLRGYSLDTAIQHHWDAYPRLLKDAQPVYVFVSANSLPFIRARSPGIGELLDSDYSPFWNGAAGHWYELNAGK